MTRFRAFASALASVALCGLAAGRAEAQAIPASGEIVSAHTGMCATIVGGSSAPGARALQQLCLAALQQQWEFRPAPAGGHQIVNRKSGLCLAIRRASVVQGQRAEQQPCADDAVLRWSIVASGDQVEIRNVNSGQCLEIGNASTERQATLSQWSCVGASHQKWTLVGAAPRTGLLVNRFNGMCGGVPNAVPGAQLTQATCRDIAQMDWELRPAAGGAHQIVSRSSGYCFAVGGASTADNAAIVQSQCADAPSQRWSLRASGDHVELVAAHSGKCATTGAAITENAPLTQAACSGHDAQKWTVLGPATRSKWSSTIAMPLVPVAASTLRNGKVLTWSAYDRFAFGGDRGMTYTALFDPATNTSSERLVSNTGHDMFCPGTSVLPDGRILVTGGSSSKKASVYNPDTNVWTATGQLNIARGYQGDTVLSTGDVFTAGGSWSGGVGGKNGEVWSRSSGAWRTLSGVSGDALAATGATGTDRDYHMWFYGAANGYVFHAGPSAEMHWVDTAGAGRILAAGNRADDAYAQSASVVMYEAGKLFTAGGAPGHDGGAKATAAAYTIDFSRGPGQPVAVARGKPMAFPRAYQNTVVLPSGEVVVIGGQSYMRIFNDAHSIQIPEIWSPATGQFTRLAQHARPRNYHSVAVLLLDGRVLTGGGGLCGRDCAANHPNVEILTPPYLLNADGSPAPRPAILAAPTTAGLGATVAVTTDGPVASFAIVRLNAATHSLNNDQRRLPLPIASASGTTYQLVLPNDRGALIAGDWMLFAMNDKGAPSVAKIVRMQ